MIDLSHLAFYSLMMAFLSLWVYRSAWLWGAFLAISYMLAFHTGIVQPFSIIPIGLLFVIFLTFKQELQPNTRLILALIATVIVTGLNFHWMPGFHNWHVGGNLWINYDKPFMGLFVLAFLLPLLRTPLEWSQLALKAVLLTAATIFILALLAMLSGTIGWQVKIPSHFFMRIASNLFLVSIPEEAFFRGFIQQEIFKSLGSDTGGAKSSIIAILGASLLFTLFHIGWTASAAMLGFVFLASALYGTIYQYTKAIEASIFCHFAVNLMHMLFFTYHVG